MKLLAFIFEQPSYGYLPFLIRYVSRFTFLLQNTVSEMQVESSSALKNECQYALNEYKYALFRNATTTGYRPTHGTAGGGGDMESTKSNQLSLPQRYCCKKEKDSKFLFTKQEPNTPAPRSMGAIITANHNNRSGPEVIKLFSCSTQLNAEFILLINVQMPTIVGILTFISLINTTSERLKARNFLICWYFSFYEQL